MMIYNNDNLMILYYLYYIIYIILYIYYIVILYYKLCILCYFRFDLEKEMNWKVSEIFLLPNN